MHGSAQKLVSLIMNGPFFVRSTGETGSSGAGTFYFANTDGGAYKNYSFRIAIIP